MTLTDGNIHTFELPTEQFHKLRYNVAFVLKVDPTHKQTLIVKASVDKVNKAYKDKQAAAFKGMFSSK